MASMLRPFKNSSRAKLSRVRRVEVRRAEIVTTAPRNGLVDGGQPRVADPPAARSCSLKVEPTSMLLPVPMLLPVRTTVDLMPTDGSRSIATLPRFSRPYVYGALGPGYFYYGSYGWYPRATFYYDGGSFGRGYGYDSGEVRLQVQPRFAEVYVDGYYAGTVDDFDGTFQSLRLESGPYHIEIVAPGYNTGSRPPGLRWPESHIEAHCVRSSNPRRHVE